MDSTRALTGTERIREFLTREAGLTSMVLFAQAGRYQIYAAVVEEKRGLERVVARPFIISYKAGGEMVGYEALREGDDAATRCPAKVLNLLSPTDDARLLRWRVRSRAYNLHLQAREVRGYARNRFRLKSASERLVRERSALDHSLQLLRLFDEGRSGEKGIGSCGYYVKTTARDLRGGRVRVEFEGLGGARAAFTMSRATYLRWPEDSYPTVYDFSAAGPLKQARPGGRQLPPAREAGGTYSTRRRRAPW